MSSHPKLKTAFKKKRSIGPLITSGPVAVTDDGQRIVTCVGQEALLTEISTGVEICRFSGDTEEIYSLCVSPSSEHLIIFTAANALRIFAIPDSTIPLDRTIHPLRNISRAHDSPVHICTIDPTSTYLASGSADGVVKVWDIAKGYITHVFKGHGGVVSALTFSFPQDLSAVSPTTSMKLVTGCVDTRVRVFDLSASLSKGSKKLKPEVVLEGHVSVVRSLDVSEDGRWLISAGRDSVVLLWDLDSASEKDSKLVKTIPILERVEAAGIVQSPSKSGNLSFYTGGEKGVLKLWNGKTGKLLATFGSHDIQGGDEDQRQIMAAFYNPKTSSLISVHADQNVLIYSLETQRLTRQLIGFNDEIVDAAFLSTQSPDALVALATNSSLIRVYSATSADARLLEGHSDIVLCLDTSPSGHFLASAGKDRSARVWAPLADESSSWGLGCVAVCEGHTESIGALAFSRGSDSSDPLSTFMFTGSQDKTIKMWQLDGVPHQYHPTTEPRKCRSLCTQKAHNKDINSLDVAPNNKLLASGSQDRLVNLYQIVYSQSKAGARGTLKLLGTFKGHKRGVWAVKFSRTEKLLATGGGDKTIKLWNLGDFTCVKTFEGHTNSVLRVDFLTAGQQLVSSASDGLVKIWNVQTEECMATLDNHEDKVWALALSRNERSIVSAGADSVITFWEDCTQEQEVAKEAERSELVLKEQDFVNFIATNNFQQALQLALDMQQPGRLLALFKNLDNSEYSASGVSLTGNTAVDQVLCTLPGSYLARLLRYVAEWNSNAKTSTVAQRVLHAILKLRTADDVMAAFKDEAMEATMLNGVSKPSQRKDMGLKETIDALIPYTERHLVRMNRLLQESYMVDFILSEMDDGMLEMGDGMDVDTNG